jgi:hypothetical protein
MGLKKGYPRHAMQAMQRHKGFLHSAGVGESGKSGDL